MELKVGMYIRTRDENISKIKYINKFIYTDKQRYGKHYIEKASENIIDLIEVGDYVNGKEVTEILTDEHGNVTDIAYLEEVEGQAYSLQPIKNIVTKEQFESIKYIVEK